MPNSIINNTIITRNALGLYLNENSLVKTINTKYGDEFGKGRNGDGKIGMTLDIRMPNDFVLRRGVIAAPQAINETFQPLTITQQNGADFGFTTAERTLKIEEFNKRYTKPAVNTILGGVATDIMSMTLGFQNMVRNADPVSGATLNPTANTWLRANAKLEKQNAPKTDRWAVLDPDADAATVSGLMGLFNPAGQIGEQTRDGHMGSRLLGLEGWMMDQTVLTQQTGSYAGGSTITAVPAQGANVLQCTALNGGLNAGDVITVAGCFQVNRVTKQNYFQLLQFVVAQTTASGATSIPVGPAIIGPKVDIGDGTGTAVAHQNDQPPSGVPIEILVQGWPSWG